MSAIMGASNTDPYWQPDVERLVYLRDELHRHERVAAEDEGVVIEGDGPAAEQR